MENISIKWIKKQEKKLKRKALEWQVIWKFFWGKLEVMWVEMIWKIYRRAKIREENMKESIEVGWKVVWFWVRNVFVINITYHQLIFWNQTWRIKTVNSEIISGGPFSLIKYEAEIEISDSIEDYQKAKNSQKVLDPKPSPEGTTLSYCSRCS